MAGKMTEQGWVYEADPHVTHGQYVGDRLVEVPRLPEFPISAELQALIDADPERFKRVLLEWMRDKW